MTLNHMQVPKDQRVPTGASKPITCLHLIPVRHADSLHVYKSPACSSANEVLQKQSLISSHRASATRQTMSAYCNWQIPTSSNPHNTFFFLPIDISHRDASVTAGNENVAKTLAAPAFSLDGAREQTSIAKSSARTVDVHIKGTIYPVLNGEEDLIVLQYYWEVLLSRENNDGSCICSVFFAHFLSW